MNFSLCTETPNHCDCFFRKLHCEDSFLSNKMVNDSESGIVF